MSERRTVLRWEAGRLHFEGRTRSVTAEGLWALHDRLRARLDASRWSRADTEAVGRHLWS